MVTVVHHTPVAKRCIVLKRCDDLNFDGSAGKHQKTSMFPPIRILCYTVATELWIIEHTKFTKSEFHGNYQPYVKCLHRESGHIQLYAIDKLCIIVESSNS